jgi:endonuclease V-like protein UPF0215 family
MARSTYSNVVGFDDFPFPRFHKGNVQIVGTIYTKLRLDGVIRGVIRKDGANATNQLIKLVQESKFAPQLQLIMLQGIALGGFNVVDIHRLQNSLSLPVLVVARRQPNFQSIKDALLTRVPGGDRKWRLIERAGEVERVAGVYIQRVGLSNSEAAKVIKAYAVHSKIPEPLRAAHLIAGGIATGQSRGRP